MKSYKNIEKNLVDLFLQKKKTKNTAKKSSKLEMNISMAMLFPKLQAQ
jgi:hypothetical protein